jgi:hypothetical protein
VGCLSGPLRAWLDRRERYRAAVLQDLSDQQWNAVDGGQLSAPTGITYSRQTTRMKRQKAASLVESGCPVFTYWPGGLPDKTRVVWHDGADARAAWKSARAEVTSDSPRPPRGGSVVTAGRWESPDGDALVVLTWHH